MTVEVSAHMSCPDALLAIRRHETSHAPTHPITYASLTHAVHLRPWANGSGLEYAGLGRGGGGGGGGRGRRGHW